MSNLTMHNGISQGNCWLSICIATRNRCDFLLETLSSALVQIGDGVEIIVVDGESSDNTQTAVTRLAIQDKRVRYFRETTNGGIDKDYDKAVNYASGTYCWLMGDDDLFLPGAFQRVRDAATLNPSVIVVDAEVRDAKQAKLLLPRRLELASDRIFAANELEAFFVATARQLTFIGSAIVKRSVWLSRKREIYFGSYFIHVGVIFQDRLPDGAIVLIKPAISIRYGNVSWSAKSFEIWTSKWPNLIWSLDSISMKGKASIVAKRPFWSARELVMMRSTGAYSWKQFRTAVLPSSTSIQTKLTCAAIALTPGVLANLTSIAYVLMFSRAPKLAMVDLTGSPYYIFKFMQRTLAKSHAKITDK